LDKFDTIAKMAEKKLIEIYPIRIVSYSFGILRLSFISEVENGLLIAKFYKCKIQKNVFISKLKTDYKEKYYSKVSIRKCYVPNHINCRHRIQPLGKNLGERNES
jgi:hypothetical protein